MMNQDTVLKRKEAVAFVIDSDKKYPMDGYSPSISYPEYRFDDISPSKNSVYDKVRTCLYELGMDRKHFGDPAWNPLGEIVQPGNKVVIKPNWVMHVNPEEQFGSMECLVTHPSVLRAVIDYVLIALQGEGEIVVGDAPMYQCDLPTLLDKVGYNKLWQYYDDKSSVQIRVVDFRNLVINRDKSIKENKRIAADNGVIVDLGEKSSLDEFSAEQIKDFRIFGYSHKLMSENHQKGRHRFLVSQEMLTADVIINVPKCKTHRKAGMTACAKNFVGINCRKEYLPHHRTGSRQSGGDEYPYTNLFKTIHTKIQERHDATLTPSLPLRFFRKFSRGVELVLTRDKKYDGCWYGNDTLWRTITDLNIVVEYADCEGVIKEEKQRIVFNICDLIIAGEEEGPLRPKPKPLGAIIAGYSVPAVDFFVSALMGFDEQKVKYIPHMMMKAGLTKADIRVLANENEYTMSNFPFKKEWHFKPTSGWKGHIEQN